MPFLDQAGYRHAQYFMLALQAADCLCEVGGNQLFEGLRHLDFDLANIQTGHTWAVSRYSQNQEAAKLCADYNDAGPHCLGTRLLPREYAEWLQVGLKAARFLQDQESELAIVFHLVDILPSNKGRK